MARSKWGAKLTTVDGHLFRSKWEAARYRELQLLEREGGISELSFKPPRFSLHDPYTNKRTGKRVKSSYYTPDFVYKDKDGAVVLEDAKGYTRAESKLKRKIVESRYGVIIWFVYDDGRRE